MTKIIEDNPTMREFLLDYLNLDERERIEEQFMVNPAFREKLLIAEECLIEEYLEDSLNETDLSQFKSVFFSSPQLREKLAFARALRARAKAEVTVDLVSQAAGTQRALHFSIRQALWIAAAVVIVILGTVWLIQRGSGNESAEERTRRLAIQTQLTELNSYSQAQPAELLSLVLAPVNTRGSGAPGISRSGDPVAEFWLIPASSQTINFKASIRR